MKSKSSYVVYIKDMSDIDKINDDTRYVNIDITNINYDVIKYFKENGSYYMYSDIIDNICGYNYISYEDFIKAEDMIEMIYANMKSDLSDIEIAKYLYISLANRLSYDINAFEDKSEVYNLSLINMVNNLWGSLAIGKCNDISASKLYYYLCRRLNIDINIFIDEVKKQALTKLIIDNQVLVTDLYEDIPYINCGMQTKYFAIYNDDIDLDKKIGYVKNKYTNYYLNKVLRDIDYTKDDCIYEILINTQEIIKANLVKPVELGIIYKNIFNEYCPNYHIEINNLFLNTKKKKHFIMISYNNNHYSYNYKEKSFVKVNDEDILDSISLGKIGLYMNECIPNINNY